MGNSIAQGIEWLEWFIEALEDSKVGHTYDITIHGRSNRNQAHIDESGFEGLKDCLSAARVIGYMRSPCVYFGVKNNLKGH